MANNAVLLGRVETITEVNCDKAHDKLRKCIENYCEKV